MTRITWSLIIACVLIATLVVSKPTTKDFLFFVRKNVESEIHSGSAIGDAVARELVVSAVAESTYYRDYLVFATLTVDTSTLQLFQPDLPPDLSFLGVGGKIIPLSDLGPLSTQ